MNKYYICPSIGINFRDKKLLVSIVTKLDTILETKKIIGIKKLLV